MMSRVFHDLEARAADLFERFLARTHLCRPSEAGDVVVEELQRALEATEVVVYWANRERSWLAPLASRSSPVRSEQQVEGSVAGRAFISSRVLSFPGSGPGRRRVFVPILDGTDRVGVLELEVALDDDAELPDPVVAVLERYGHATAQMLVAKKAYGDPLELVQRSRPMELGAELLWSVLPPLTFATDGLVVSAVLEPAYDNGGDAFDYAVNEDLVHLAVFDGVGHGLQAASMSTFAVAAYRHSRRTGLGLVESYAAMDVAVAAQFGEESFVTGVLAQLDPTTGVLRWVNAGHPEPLLLRGNRVVKTLEAAPATPFGLPMFSTEVTVGEEQIEPGDAIVLYTDGVVEARRPDGSLLGLDGFTELLQIEAAAEQSPSETLRRLRRTLLDQESTVLKDDATVMLVDWRRGTERLLLPQTI
jgi:hypothetical protein